MAPLADLTNGLRATYPDCKIAIWASLECTNYSKAKGGQSRNADSRSLADHLFRYLNFIDPDFLWIENVREFMTWGPLDEKGIPIKDRKCEDYDRWVNQVKSYGFDYDYRLLNSADFGAYTSRERYFAQFSKDPELIAWPKQTHAKITKKNLPLIRQNSLHKWKGVREVLNLQDEGVSIFERKKPLSDNTLKRIYAGLLKFVANGDDSFLKKYYSGGLNSQVSSVNDPSGSLTTVNHNSLVKCIFLTSYYNNSTFVNEESPCGTLTTKDRFTKIEAQFLDNQYGNSKPSSVNNPSGALTPTPKQNLISAKPWLMDTSFKNTGSNLNDPAGTILANRKYHYIINPSWFNQSAGDIDKPCATLIARMDKSPLYLVSPEKGELSIVVYETDSEPMIQIKKFMAAYGIIDVKMRMLQISEMLRIQGFPEWYRLKGTQTEQKKYIGNSVEVTVGKHIFQAIDAQIQQLVSA